MKPVPDQVIQLQIATAKKAVELLDLDDEAFQLTLESETMAVEHCEMLTTAALYADIEKQKQKATADLHAARAKHWEARYDVLRSRLSKIVAATGKKSLTTTIATLINVARTDVDIFDEDLLPSKYLTLPAPEPMKNLINEDLRAGIEVPGARISEPEISLTIKVK